MNGEHATTNQLQWLLILLILRNGRASVCHFPALIEL